MTGQILHELSHRNTAGFHVASGCGTGGVDDLGFRGSVVGECDSMSETSSARCGGSTDRYAIDWVATGSH